MRGLIVQDSPPEVDRIVQRELQALSRVLESLREQDAGGAEQSVQDDMPADGSPVARWWVTVGPVTRLQLIANIRARLSAMPWCVLAEVVNISSAEARLLVTTTSSIARKDVGAVIVQVIRERHEEGDSVTVKVGPDTRMMAAQ